MADKKGIQVNQIRAGVALSYIYLAAVSAIQLIYLPIALRLMGDSEYGLYQVAVSLVGYLKLLNMGMIGSYVRFYTQQKQKGSEAVARLNGMYFIVYTTMGMIALAAAWVISMDPELVFGTKFSAEELRRAQILVRILSVQMLFVFLSYVFKSYITVHERYVFDKLWSILLLVTDPIFSIILLGAGWGSIGVVLVPALLSIVDAVVAVLYCFKKLNMRLAFRQLQWSIMGKVWVFSLFLFLNSLIDQLNMSVDKLLLGRLWGGVQVAVYSLGYTINGVFQSFSTSLSAVFVPRVNRVVNESGESARSELTDLMIRLGRIQGLLILLLLAGFILLGRPFSVWFGGKAIYEKSYYVVLLLVVPGSISLIQTLGVEIQRAMNLHRYQTLIYACMTAVNIAVSIPMAKQWGAVGSAAGTAISLLIGNGVVVNCFYHRRMGLDMAAFWKSILHMARGAVLPVCYCAICMFFLDLFQPAVFFISGAGLVAIYCLSMWRWGMNEQEKSMVIGMLGTLRRKVRRK